MGNFELALSLNHHHVPICYPKKVSPSTRNLGDATGSESLPLISAPRHQLSPVRGPRRRTIGSSNPGLHKPKPCLPSLFSRSRTRRSWPIPSSLFRNLAIGVIGTAALLFQGFSYADAASAPPRYPCEDVARYYAGTESLEGTSLMRRLYSIVSDQKSLPYKKVWDALKILDAADVDNPETSSEIIEIYSLKSVSKALAGKPEGWNREHLWPRSYGLIDHPSLTDLHNIRPADVNVNSSRGNKYFGECLSGSNGCVQPANYEAAFDTETDKKSWTPPSQVRGDIARSLMYMAVRYGFDGSPHLMLSDSPNAGSREMGLLSTLLKWNKLDPPSREERLRNDRICHLYQHNRNPFIDHPDYAEIIWKHTVPPKQAGQMQSLKAWINEFHYNNKGMDENEFLEIIVAPSTDASKLQALLYNGANGKVYEALPLQDRRLFSITGSSRSGRDSDSSGYSIYTAVVQLQNGPADGIALVLSTTPEGDDPGQVIQFISYQGTVRAVDGPAAGSRSVDIKVEETEESGTLDSIGLAGDPQLQAGFQWRKFVGNATPGKVNPGQFF